MRNMVSWLLVHLAIISRDDYVIMILLCCFDLSGRHIVPRSLWSPHVHSQHRKDNTWGPARAWRLIWIAHYSHTSPWQPLEKGAERRTSVSIIWGPTPEERPGYGLKPSGIKLNWTELRYIVDGMHPKSHKKGLPWWLGGVKSLLFKYIIQPQVIWLDPIIALTRQYRHVT